MIILKRLGLGAWCLWTFWFTYSSNRIVGLRHNILADALVSIALFNAIPWLILYRGRIKRERLQRAHQSGDVPGSIELHNTYWRIMRFLGSGVLIAGGLFAISWSANQLDFLNEIEVPTNTDTFKDGVQGSLISWSQVARRDNVPRTWHTCQTINVWVNEDGYKPAIEDVKAIIADVNSMTGLHFKYAGVSALIPPQLYIPGLPSVLIAFYTEKESLHGFEFGTGIARAAASGTGELSGAFIGIRMPEYQKLARPIQVQVMAHEFGHVLGLGHTTTKGELMAPVVTGEHLTYNNTVRKYFAAHPGCSTSAD